MSSGRLLGLLLGATLWTSSASAQAQDPPRPTLELTHDRALALARERAPTLAVARGRAREAESEVYAAGVRRFNPQLSGAAGPRLHDGGATLDWSVGLQQWVETGGQPRARSEASRAGADAASARSDDALRRLLREVSLAFVAALYWDLRTELADESLRVAESLAHVAARRHAVGDVGALETAAADLAVERARLEAEQARASRTRAEARVRALLGLEADVACRGELRDMALADIGDGAATHRPDISALEAEVARAEAEVALGRADRAPNLAVGVGYAREEAADVVQGTLTIALPVFDHGQGATAVAEARRERLRAELDGARVQAAAEADADRATTDRLVDALRRFERDALGLVERSEALAVTSHAAGEIPLRALLEVRRELLRARLEHADLLLSTATSRVERAASTGALR